MPYNCPHCAAAIEDVIPKDRFEAVNAAKNKAESDLKAAQRSAAMYDALKPEYDALKASAADIATVRAELATFREKHEDALFMGVGIKAPSVRRVLKMEFDAQASADGGEKDFGAWLGKVKTAPPEDLAPFFPTVAAAPAPAPAAAPVAAAAAAPPAPGLPRPSAGSVPPPPAPAARVTVQQAHAYFESPEYKALPPAEKLKKLNEMKAQAAGGGASPAV